MEHNAGAESRTIRKDDVVGTLPHVFRGCVASGFCEPLLQCRETLARLHGLRAEVIGPRYELFRGAESELRDDHRPAACDGLQRGVDFDR